MGNVEGAAQAIADALAPTQQSPSARWRWGTVASVQDDGTITATVGGTTVSGIRASQQAMGAEAGDRVRICHIGTEAFADSLRASSKLMRLPTIDGALTATGRITGAGITSTGAHLDVQSTNFTDAVTPSASYNGNGIISLRDKNGKEIGYVRPESFKDGYQGIAIAAKRTDGGTIHETLLRIAVNSAGSTWVGFTGDGKTAWRNALDAVGASDQSRQNARFITLVGATQVYGLWATCINANNTSYNGKEVGVIFENSGMSLWNSTANSTIWKLSGLSGTINLDSTAWQTLATNVTYRRHRGWVIVKFDNHAYTGSGSEVVLGTLAAGYRPDGYTYSALFNTGVGTTAVPYVSVAADGTVRVNGRASGAHLYGEIVFPV